MPCCVSIGEDRMMGCPDTMFTLSKKKGGFGLDCNAQVIPLLPFPGNPLYGGV